MKKSLFFKKKISQIERDNPKKNYGPSFGNGKAGILVAWAVDKQRLKKGQIKHRKCAVTSYHSANST